MNILILNWRDIKNPKAGGAEVLTHEMAKRWVMKGHSVTLFSSQFPGSSPGENLDGVTIIRRGQWWNVQVWAFFYYVFLFHNSTDVILDEVHWVPFFSVLYARKKVVLLVCEVARQLFFRLFPYPIAVLGRFIEKVYFFLYRAVPVLAISPSTKQDLIGEGILEKNITILPMGLTVPKLTKRFPKEKTPTVLFIGRIHPLKGVIDAIDALNIMRKNLPQVKLWIGGTGEAPYIKTLQDHIEQLDLTANVQFLGYLSEEEKFNMYQRAHILLVPSVQEGWGLVVIEAASQGTPTVAYDVPGLRDTVKNGITGVLTKENSPEEMAKEALMLIKDKKRYNKFQENTLKWAKILTWEKTTLKCLELITEVRNKIKK